MHSLHIRPRCDQRVTKCQSGQSGQSGQSELLTPAEGATTQLSFDISFKTVHSAKVKLRPLAKVKLRPLAKVKLRPLAKVKLQPLAKVKLWPLGLLSK